MSTTFARCPLTPEDSDILARTDPECWTRVLDRSESFYMYGVMSSPATTIGAHHIQLATRGIHGEPWHALAAEIIAGVRA